MTRTAPAISVVIAAYNHERYVAHAIESVLAQDFGDFEIILIDDGSSDRTLEIARSFRDPRIMCSAAARNAGASATYNACIERSRGRYIAVLNSDDSFLPEKLKRQAALLDARPEVGAVFTHARMVGEQGQTLAPSGELFARANRSRFAWLRRFFFKGNCLCHPSVMIRRQVHDEVGLYDPRFAQIHDLDLWIRVCERHEIHVIETPLTCFRLRDGEANANNSRPETLNRIMWEYTHVIRRYARIGSAAEFLAIFPDADVDPERWDPATRANALAKLAINVPNLAHAGLGLSLLHELFGDLGALEMERRFGLPLSRYLKLTGEIDLFRTHEFARLRGT